MARELEKAGAQVLGIKDMAGVCRPAAARTLVKALKQEIGLPIHFHTHDTSGISAASVIAAAEAGADAVDAAIDSMSGSTSQPNLGAIVEAFRHTPLDTGLDPAVLRRISHYFEQVRALYRPFESDLRWGASEVYVHEMPGGQYTNLRQQAQALGLADKWPEVAAMYAEVNQMFGDVIKVTPTSKVVGDLALMMVTRGLTPEAVLDPATEIAFPDSVISFFRGDIGQPPGGFAPALQRKVLGETRPLTVRPGSVLPPVDLAAARQQVERQAGRPVDDRDLASYLMYPKVFVDYARSRRQYDDISVLPTRTFFYGMEPAEEISASIERGKSLVIRYLALGDADERGERSVFFELNGEPRAIKIADAKLADVRAVHRKADRGDPGQVGAPMQGRVIAFSVAQGDSIRRGDPLATLEAMKMEMMVRAECNGRVVEVCLAAGTEVTTDDLLMVIEPTD
jgi:pyruvate carboxylase